MLYAAAGRAGFSRAQKNKAAANARFAAALLWFRILFVCFTQICRWFYFGFHLSQRPAAASVSSSS
jgi:hypothetical protein